MLSLERLHAFVVFAEHMNFTRAARALHVSQPALHAQVAKLSEELGVPLYRRRGRQLELTPDGRRVLGFGRELRERASQLLDDLRLREGRRPVVLCAGEGAYLYLLGPAIRRFTERGEAPLSLLTRDRDGTVEAVLSGEAHLGVASLDEPPAGLSAERLTEVEQVLVVREDHPLARRRAVRLRDLDGARLVIPAAGRPHRVMLAQALAAAGVSWEVAVEVSGWELSIHFVALGLGLAVVNGFCRVPQGLVARPLPELPRRPYDLLRRRGAPEGGPVDALRRELAASANAWRKGGAVRRASA